MTDFTLDDHGRIILMRPETLAALHWIQENLMDGGTWVAGSIVIDRNFLDEILIDLFRDDLTWATPTPTLH